MKITAEYKGKQVMFDIPDETQDVTDYKEW